MKYDCNKYINIDVRIVDVHIIAVKIHIPPDNYPPPLPLPYQTQGLAGHTAETQHSGAGSSGRFQRDSHSGTHPPGSENTHLALSPEKQ